MRVFDLSHTLETGMPVYPGTEEAKLFRTADLASAGYNETALRISSHTGTHIDCPRHFINDGSSTESCPTETFYGKGLKINCLEPGLQRITVRHMQPYGSLLAQVDFVIFHTGWSRFWQKDRYFSDFPVPDPDMARLLTTYRLKGAGTDTISFDAAGSTAFEVHKILLSKGIVLIENLTGLEKLPDEPFIFSCFPLKIRDGDGSPVRAVGIVKSDE